MLPSAMLTHAQASSAGMCLLRLSYSRIINRKIILTDPFFLSSPIWISLQYFVPNSLCQQTLKRHFSVDHKFENIPLDISWCLLLSPQRCFYYFPLQAKHAQFLRQQQATISPCPLNARSKNGICKAMQQAMISCIWDVIHFPSLV